MKNSSLTDKQLKNTPINKKITMEKVSDTCAGASKMAPAKKKNKKKQ